MHRWQQLLQHHYKILQLLPQVNTVIKVRQPWIAYRADSNSWIINCQVTMMVLFEFISLFTFSHGGTGINKGTCPLMWHAALCSGLVALSCGWAELWRNPPTLKKKKISSSLNVMVHYCLLEWAWMLVSNSSSLLQGFFSQFSLLSILVLHVTQLNEASEFVQWQFVLLCFKSNITMSQSKLTGCCSIWITLQLAAQSIECLNATFHIVL